MPHDRLAIIALTLALVALLLLVVSGLGYRNALWALPAAFTMVKWAAYLGIAGGLVALVGMFIARPVGRTTFLFAVAFLLAVVAAGIPWSLKRRAGQVPPIHDISTDTQDPPAFVAVLPLRANAKNSAAYGGDSVAALQHAGYPDITPIHLALPSDAAFQRARDAAAAMGWAMVATDSAAGRIEATATTRWFGFKDDIVIRVRGEGVRSRVDVRSVSRIGGSDVGTNAARIRAYAARLGGSSAGA